VRIVLSSDGDGGTNLTLDKAAAPAVARLTQAMAALASAGSAASLHTADSSSARLAMIASPGRLN
jgi:NADPH-dependent ferric siderophore reductase